MSNWRNIGSVVKHHTKGVTPKYVDSSSIIVLNQKCIRNNKIDFSLAQYTNDKIKYPENKFINIGDILINSTGQGTAGRVAIVENIPKGFKLIIDSHILLIRCNNYYEAKCLNYSLYSFEKMLQSFMDGSTGQGEFDKVRLFNLKINYSKDIETQQKIADVLSSLDAKIETNNRINIELEAMAKTLYDYWFVQFDFPDANGNPYKNSGGKMVYSEELKRDIPEGWEVKTLLDIATFTNGLACQKFRPKNEEHYRVIKIREMGSGFTENSEFVTVNIPEKVIVNNGDILFSWSATLDVKIWTGGKGALNQHIFKVTSKKFPRSYYFFELLNYLQHFKMIAELRKTTMGHITQDHLQQSRISIPTTDLINKLDEIINPILEKKIKLEEENQKITHLRDWLLPMLMNGQVTVNDAREQLGMVAESSTQYGN